MAIPRETIDLIRDRAQIEEIIKRYVPSLKKRGNNYIALCPFHKEKTPSFTISPDKQIFHCFGCHEGGNIFSFISKIEGMSFPESVRFVGEIVGIRVENDSRTEEDNKFDKLREINRISMEFFHNIINTETGKSGFQYLLKRGVKEESIREFKLGFSPDSWHSLVNYLNSKEIPPLLPSELGLIGISDKSGNSMKYYDRFRGRVMFPIFDQNENVVGFGGRITGEGEPKYINSQESIIYQKRKILYGFNIAKKHISELKRAIVVEGYMDVIGCHQAGVKNVVAPLGTALTSEQVRQLARYAGEIILLFDSDSAGIAASLRSIGIFDDISVDVKIAVLPDGDPFDYIARKGIRELMAVVDRSLKPVDFRIQRAAAEGIKKDRVKVLIDIFNIIKDIEYETERSLYLKKVSSMLSIDENSVRNDYNRFLNGFGNSKKFSMPAREDREDFLVRSYRDMVVLLCNFPELIEQAVLDFSDGELSDFPDSVSKNIFDKIRLIYSSNKVTSIEKMFDFFTEGVEKDFLKSNMLSDASIEDPEAVYTQLYLNIKLYRIEQKRNMYIDKIKNSGVSDADINAYTAEIQVLSRERDKLLPFVNK